MTRSFIEARISQLRHFAAIGSRWRLRSALGCVVVLSVVVSTPAATQTEELLRGSFVTQTRGDGALIPGVRVDWVAESIDVLRPGDLVQLIGAGERRR